MSNDTDYEQIKRIVDSAIARIGEGNPTARCTGAEIADTIASRNSMRGFEYFLRHAPQNVLDEAIVFLKHLKEKNSFYYPGAAFGSRSGDQLERDSLANQRMYLKMYQVLVLRDASVLKEL